MHEVVLQTFGMRYVFQNRLKWQKSNCLRTFLTALVYSAQFSFPSNQYNLFKIINVSNIYFICILLFKHFPSIKSNLSLQLHMLEFPTRRHVFALSVPVHCWCVSHISFNSLPATIKQFRQNQWMNLSYKFNRRIKCIAFSSFRSCFPKQ